MEKRTMHNQPWVSKIIDYEFCDEIWIGPLSDYDGELIFFTLHRLKAACTGFTSTCDLVYTK